MTITIPTRICWDIETKGQSEDPYELEVSLITLIDTEFPRRRLQFDEDNISNCIDYMLASPGFVGFNSKAFDFPVMMKYTDRAHGRALRAKPHYDIYDEFMRKYQRRISLRNIAYNTLRMDKFEMLTSTAAGLYRTDPKKLRIYNYSDTHLTYLLYIHTMTYGYLYFKLPTLRKFTPETISRPGLT